MRRTHRSERSAWARVQVGESDSRTRPGFVDCGGTGAAARSVAPSQRIAHSIPAQRCSGTTQSSSPRAERVPSHHTGSDASPPAGRDRAPLGEEDERKIRAASCGRRRTPITRSRHRTGRFCGRNSNTSRHWPVESWRRRTRDTRRSGPVGAAPATIRGGRRPGAWDPADRPRTGMSTRRSTSWPPGFSPPERQSGPWGLWSLQSRVRERPDSALSHVSPIGWILQDLAIPLPSIHESDRDRPLHLQDSTARN